MLAKRVVAIASDRALGKRIVAAAMAAGGTAELFTSLDELGGRVDAEVFVCAVQSHDDPAFGRLLSSVPPTTRIVPLVPASDLALMTWLLGSPNVPAILVSEGLSPAVLTATLGKLLYGDLFGLEKVLPWGVKIHSILVGDFQEKARAITEVSEFAAALGVRRKYRENIEQSLDELLMNALYDAPVDGEGRQVFAEIAVKDRLTMRVQEQAVVQYACDGERFALSVRDAYGSIRKGTILSFLDKCLHQPGIEQIDRKTSGAGLGLYLIANGCSQLSFHIFPTVATEVVCCFALDAPRVQLTAFGVFEERLAHGKPASGPIHTVRRRRRDDLIQPSATAARLPRSLTFALAGASALLLAAVGLVALPYLRAPSLVTMSFESDPRGATISVDGRVRGVADAPLAVTGLELGRSYAVRAALPGRRDEDRLVTAAAGETVQLKLAPSPTAGVVIQSDPAGAQIFVDGRSVDRVTPAPIDLAPGAHAEVTLHKSGFADQTIKVESSGSGELTVYRVTLDLDAEVGAVSIEVVSADEKTPIVPSVSIDGLLLVPPGAVHEAFIKPGVAHTITMSAPGFVTRTEGLAVGAGQRKELRIALAPGGALDLRSTLGLTVAVDDKPAGNTPLTHFTLSPGKHLLSLRGGKPLVWIDEAITIERGQTLDRSLDFGTVVVIASGVTARPLGATRSASEVALTPGTHHVTLIGPGGEQHDREVTVTAGRKTTIDSF